LWFISAVVTEIWMGRAERVLSEVLRDLVGFEGVITPELRQEDVRGWDSMAHIAIVEELESSFRVRFTTEEMVEMTSVPAIKAALARHGITDA
jgi:acyl carrier protein